MSASSRSLLTPLAGRRIGTVEMDRSGRLSFVYDARWQRAADAIPLSSSMPLSVPRHEGEAVEAFLWGLPPDSDIILNRWAARFQVSARNAFGLLAHVGEDCSWSGGGRAR